MERQGEDGGGGQGDADPLPDIQPLPQKEEPEKNADQGVEKIAEARLQDLPLFHGVDEDQPVGGDQERGGGEGEEEGAVAEGAPDGAVLPVKADHREQKEKRPEDAVGDDLQRPGAGQGLEERRETSPDQVGRQAEEDPLAGEIRRLPLGRFRSHIMHEASLTG